MKLTFCGRIYSRQQKEQWSPRRSFDKLLHYLY
jgi:hypothetical protein